jgi:CSLREA domain-containing protein
MGHDGPATSCAERSQRAPSRMRWRRLPLLLAFAALLAGCAVMLQPTMSVYAATIVVTTTNDAPVASDGCSLREAITNANNNNTSGSAECAPGDNLPEGDLITFQLGTVPVPFPHRIDLLSQLPDIVGRVTIDGWTQGPANYFGPPLVWIDTATGVDGLTIKGDQVTVKGLAITKFFSGIVISGTGTHTIVGSYIGARPALAAQSGSFVATETVIIEPPGCGCPNGNVDGIDVIGNPPTSSPTVTIGGKGTGEGNVIVGNSASGVDLLNAAGVSLLGNFIGTDRSGADNLGNGVGAQAVGTLNISIGDGTPDGRNVVSGQDGGPGIVVAGAESVSIKGNYIGVTPSGLAPLANALGIQIFSAFDVDIGGTTAGARNIISGNTTDGVSLAGVCICFDLVTKVRGNYIGLNAAGDAAIPNGQNGVHVLDAIGVVVGGSEPGEGNVVSGNTVDGITIVGEFSEAIEVSGNRVGTNPAGTAAIGNGRDGISVKREDGGTDGPIATVIGFDTPGTGNLVSGNGRHGIYVFATSDDPTFFEETFVIHNLVGVDINGAGSIPNARNGVLIEQASLIIVFENVIANNGQAGVVVLPETGNPLGNIVATNAIFNNQGLGIDVTTSVDGNGNGDGRTLNDVTETDGIQNYPAITTATTSAAGTVVGGTLTSTPDTSFRVELFASPSCDPSGNGEGRSFIGGLDTSTGGPGPNGAGDATFNMTVGALPPGHVITATATGPDRMTSEFSVCKSVTTAAILVTPTSGLTTTEAGGTATFTIALSTLPIADVTVGLSSGDTTEGTVSPASLTFTSANALTPQPVTITGVADAVADGNQNYSIVTAAAVSTDPAYGGMNAPDVSAVNLDSGVVPTLSIEPAEVTEGTGASVPISFTVRLAPASTQTVSATWQVADGTARLSSDIEFGDAGGTVTFNPGDLTKSIVVHIIGDTLPEPTETFTVRLQTSTGAAIGVQTATGTIRDDDVATGPCSPRPNVVMTSTRSGINQLVVTVKAGLGTLKKVTFGSVAQPMQNAQVETIGPASLIQGFGVFTPPPNVTQQSFVVRRLLPDQPAMVTLIVEDDCGEWKTFIGTGQNPW